MLAHIEGRRGRGGRHADAHPACRPTADGRVRAARAGGQRAAAIVSVDPLTEMCIYTYHARRRIDPIECRDCHCLAARRHARAITRLYEEKLRPHGLRATQFSILAALALRGPTQLTHLADFLVLERTTLTRVAARLVEAGWIDEAPSSDARQRILRITRPGRRKLEVAFPSWKEAQLLAARQPHAHAAPPQGA